jgi:hypothetical protein
MATAYYSTVLPMPVDDVWAVARDFGDYSLFTSGRGEAFVEDGEAGTCVGAIRNATLDGTNVRQRLLTHSDVDRCYQYEFCGDAPFPIENYLATLRFRPVIENDQTFVEWAASFDCAPDQRQKICARLQGSFATWIASLSARMRSFK